MVFQMTFGDAGIESVYHSGVDLNDDDLRSGVKELEGEISGARADFKDGVSGENFCFADDGVEDSGVGEEMLALALVKL